MPNLLSSRETIRILEQNGFIFVSQKGSHRKFRNGNRIVIVPDPKKRFREELSHPSSGNLVSIKKNSRLETELEFV